MKAQHPPSPTINAGRTSHPASPPDRETVIEVEALSKKFCRSLKRSMLYGSIDIARSMFGIRFDTGNLRTTEFWALRDVNFTMRKGETLGIIGVNGSGKSTLLRVINGIFPPDKGRITIKGRIGALIAIGAGFHPHMTGRENIYLNATVIGMTNKEIRERFDDIVDFADIGDFLDAPVATYSSGMNVRLGFSIAIHSRPEIFLADEVLAVGDLQFHLKCYRKLAEYRQNGGSLLIVSHSIQLIRNMCSKVLWLDGGRTREYGETQHVCDLYESFSIEKDQKCLSRETLGCKLNYDESAIITDVEFLNGSDVSVSKYYVGEPLRVRIHYACKRPVERPVFTVSFTNPENIQVISNYSTFDGYDIRSIFGTGYVDFDIDRLSLKASEYTCTITFAQNADVSNVLEWHDKAYVFVVSGNRNTSYGIMNPFPRWNFVQTREKD
jgi:lipopolysaccharide transport system ATP-binding protein